MHPEDSDSYQGLASVRLTKLSANPTADELNFALAQAATNKAAVIELPWKSGASPTFVLKVSFADAVDEGPRWSLYQGDSVDAAVLWSFDSEDTSLIESLILAECSDRVFESARTHQRSSPSLLPSNYSSDGHGPGNGGSASPRLTPNPVSNPALPAAEQLDIQAVAQIASFHKSVDGLLKHTATTYFLHQEFDRYECMRNPFAVLMFQLMVNYGRPQNQALPERALAESFRRLSGITRKIDLVGHYRDSMYAWIFPGLTSNQAIEFGKRFERELVSSPLQPGLDPEQVFLFAGVASVPDTCDSLGVLVAAAIDALEQAKQRRTSVVVFPSATTI